MPVSPGTSPSTPSAANSRTHFLSKGHRSLSTSRPWPLLPIDSIVGAPRSPTWVRYIQMHTRTILVCILGFLVTFCRPSPS